MNRLQRPPSEHRANRAGRILAEMVLKSPPRNRPLASDGGSSQLQSTAHNPLVAPRNKVKEEEKEINDSTSLAAPVAMSLVDFSYVLSLVFGGCCSNVYTYEYLLKLDPHLGTALTFSQMAFVTLQSLPSFLKWHRLSWIPISIPMPRLKPRQVPLAQWALQVLVLTTGSLLNNWAYGFSVPLTVQIIFRSAGLAVSMLFGRLFLAKRYSWPQISSVLLVTLGVIIATTSRPSSKDTTSSNIDVNQYTIGVFMLTVSLLLTGVLGILQERTYTRYGPCWKEGVFYTHALSLPIFLAFIPSVKRGFRSLNVASTFPYDSASPSSAEEYPSAIFRLIPLSTSYLLSLLNLPSSATFNSWPYVTLLLNLVTQLVCVSGVNQMTSRISSVSTNIVLTTRKAISLCFSVWWFGNGWNAQLGSGAGMVFLGSVLYTMVTSRTGAPLKVKPPAGSEPEKPKMKEKSPLAAREVASNATSPTKVPKRLGREAPVKLEQPTDDVLLTNRKWKGKARMI